jgi:co-chaperonin GroES (HSP10)
MIEALYNAVVVKPIELEETTYGNIVVPDLGDDLNKTAEVVAVGPGHIIPGGNFQPTQLQPGDTVVLPTMGFTKFTYEGDEYWIGKENEVLAKIKKTVNVESILEETELTEEDKKALNNE